MATSPRMSSLLYFMDVAKDAAWNANRKDGQFPDSLVLDASRDINDDALMQFDFLIIQDHRALASDDVIKLVGSLVVVQLGVLDLNMVNLTGRPVLLLDQAADLAAGLRPRRYLSRITTQEASRSIHRRSPRLACRQTL